MAIMKCPECGHQVSDHAKVCPSCGIDILGNITRCPSCGELTLLCYDDCPNCHQPLTNQSGGTVKVQRLMETEEPETRPHVHRQESEQRMKNSPDREEKVKKNRHVGAVVFGSALVFSLALVFLGIYMVEKMDKQNEIDAFERAVASNEPLILNDYLIRYPQAAPERRDSVEAMLERLKKIEQEWEKVFSSKNRTKIAAFVEKYPHNMHVKEARLTIDSLDWATALKANTVASYEAYLKNYANQGDHSDEAAMRMEEIKSRLAAEEQARKDSIAAAEEKKKAAEQTKPATNTATNTAKPAAPASKKP
ncbi:MAG: zinc ribbon domain-containing protein, partial [Prevotella sp.]|nr:zinc ribbon domain-containing protein [Prevotella sp.]